MAWTARLAVVPGSRVDDHEPGAGRLAQPFEFARFQAVFPARVAGGLELGDGEGLDHEQAPSTYEPCELAEEAPVEEAGLHDEIEGVRREGETGRVGEHGVGGARSGGRLRKGATGEVDARGREPQIDE